MTYRALALGGAALFAMSMMAPAADAAIVTIDNITAAWSNAIPGATFSQQGTSDPQARWGTPTGGGGQSGYGFNGVTPPALNIGVPPSPSANFTLGTFTHYNQPITGNSITSITLTVTAQILIDAVNQGTRNFVFNFLHDETPNGDDPCAFGGANGQGVNINGCADRVRVSAANTTESFNVGGIEYTLNIVGFTVGGNTLSEFLTKESFNNDALLTANVTERATIVPEPASLAILGMGLLGLGFATRRRQA